MTYLATITSKKQITLPASLFSQLNLKTGSKILLTEDKGKIVLSPAESIVHELAGILKSPKPISNSRLEKLIEDSKKKRLSRLVQK